MDTRNQWRRLRYEYYVGGRSLHMAGNYRMAGILLGYAIEAALKHGLIEAGFKHKGVLHSHEIPVLMSNFRSMGVFHNIHVSDDFIQYVNDFFKPRYPSLEEQVVASAQADNRFLIKSIDFIAYYDDLILQLDDAIYSYCGDIQASTALDALTSLTTYNGRVFFHANRAACARLNDYTQRIPADRIAPEDAQELLKGVPHLWCCKFMYQFDPRQPVESVDWHPAADFAYPRWNEDNGTKTIAIQFPLPVADSSAVRFVPDE